MPNLPQEVEEHLRNAGLDDAAIEQLRNTGEWNSRQDGNDVRVTFNSTGEIGLSQMLAQKFQASAKDGMFTSISGTLSDLDSDTGDFVRMQIAKQEVAMNMDLDGDGVIGSVSKGTSGVQAPANPVSTASSSDSHMVNTTSSQLASPIHAGGGISSPVKSGGSAANVFISLIAVFVIIGGVIYLISMSNS